MDLRAKSFGVSAAQQHLKQVFVVAAGLEALGFHADLYALVPPQQAVSDSAQDRQVLVPVLLADPALVFVERHVQPPVLLVVVGMQSGFFPNFDETSTTHLRDCRAPDTFHAGLARNRHGRHRAATRSHEDRHRFAPYRAIVR